MTDDEVRSDLVAAGEHLALALDRMHRAAEGGGRLVWLALVPALEGVRGASDLVAAVSAAVVRPAVAGREP